MTRVRAAITAIGARVAALAASAVVWFFGLVVLGAMQIVAGIYLTFGAGWALMASGVASLGAASIIRFGMVARRG